MEVVSFPTNLGAMAIAIHQQSLTALVFGRPSETAARRAMDRLLTELRLMDDSGKSPIVVDELIEQLRGFAAGEPTDFSHLSVNDQYATSFQRRVLKACRKIPWGKTVTYGQLAREVGRPGAARAVGSVMAGNRVPLVIPCHRVVPASGGLGGFSAPQGVKMKRRLLDAEQCLVGC